MEGLKLIERVEHHVSHLLIRIKLDHYPQNLIPGPQPHYNHIKDLMVCDFTCNCVCDVRILSSS